MHRGLRYPCRISIILYICFNLSRFDLSLYCRLLESERNVHCHEISVVEADLSDFYENKVYEYLNTVKPNFTYFQLILSSPAYVRRATEKTNQCYYKIYGIRYLNGSVHL